jgi:hypothetical protein
VLDLVVLENLSTWRDRSVVDCPADPIVAIIKTGGRVSGEPSKERNLKEGKIYGNHYAFNRC